MITEKHVLGGGMRVRGVAVNSGDSQTLTNRRKLMALKEEEVRSSRRSDSWKVAVSGCGVRPPGTRNWGAP